MQTKQKKPKDPSCKPVSTTSPQVVYLLKEIPVSYEVTVETPNTSPNTSLPSAQVPGTLLCNVPVNLHSVPATYAVMYETPPSTSDSSVCSVLTPSTPVRPNVTPSLRTIVDNQSNISVMPSVSNKPVSSISTLVFFDLESTGLPRFNGKLNTQITELSFLSVPRDGFEKSQFHDLRDVRMTNRFSLCIKPRCSVSFQAAKITGLDDNMLNSAHPFEESTAQLINTFLMHLPQPVCLLAHNGDNFDFPLLKAELRRVNASLPSNIHIADTLVAIRAFNLHDSGLEKTSKKKKPYHPNSLENLYSYFFKKKHLNKHSSDGDCIALMMVCHKLKEKMLPWIEENQSLFENVDPMW